MLKLAALFSDGAVLQRGKTIPVWGWADGDAKLSFELNGARAWCRAASTGNFLVRLPRQEAGGPYTLTVRNETTGEEIRRGDILIGEVWLCSGQSNMEYWLTRCPETETISVRQAHAAGLLPVHERQRQELFAQLERQSGQLRFFPMGRSISGAEELDCACARWQSIDPQHGLDCTAVGAWFALKLRRELGVPIGLLSAA